MIYDYSPTFWYESKELKVKEVKLTPFPDETLTEFRHRGDVLKEESMRAELTLEDDTKINCILRGLKHYDCRMRFLFITEEEFLKQKQERGKP